jgi:hypothetical protein
VTAADRDALVAALLDARGRTFCDELGIDIAAGSPSALFRWLVAALLFSARIDAGIALRAARALSEAGMTTPEAMADAGWEARVRVLNRAGYARFDERTATMLGESCALLLDRYGGDLRRLREDAGAVPAEERKRIKAFKGIGDVGADIFFREAQIPWPENRPFADRAALQTAGAMGLPESAGRLAALVAEEDFPRLVAALVRTTLAGDAATFPKR